MAIFKFYTYRYVPNEAQRQLHLAFDEDNKLMHADGVQQFVSLFNDKTHLDLTIAKDKKCTEWEIYKCHVLRHEAGVVLMALEDNRHKHAIIDLKDKKIEHHPYCYVIVDNRAGHMIIGIERNSAFGSNTDKVADILRNGLSNLMYDYQKHIEIERLTKNSINLWDVADEITENFNDCVKQIRIDYVGNEQNNSQSANDILAIMNQLAEKSDSNALFALNAKNNDGVKLKNIRYDMQRIAELCLAQPNYGLAVRFKNFGVYRYGSDLAAQFSMEEKVICDFRKGAKIIDFETTGQNYDLIVWLDRLHQLISNNYKNEPIQPKRTRRRRR